MQVIKKQGRYGNESSPHLTQLSLDVQVLSLLPRSVELDTVRVRGKGLVLLHFIQLLPPVIQCQGERSHMLQSIISFPDLQYEGLGMRLCKVLCQGLQLLWDTKFMLWWLHVWVPKCFKMPVWVIFCLADLLFGWLTDGSNQFLTLLLHTHTCRIISCLFHCIPYGISTLTDTPLPFSTVDCGILWYTDIVVYYDISCNVLCCGIL